MSNRKYTAISEPHPDPLAMLQTMRELKENVEVLTGQRGRRDQSLDFRVDGMERMLLDIDRRLRRAGI
jgi:hypothetical protein